MVNAPAILRIAARCLRCKPTLSSLWVRWSLPTQVSSLMRARSADIVFSGRNLGLWSKYRGIDPENDFTATGGGDVPQDFQTIGLATYWTLRFNIGF